jgi:hypothetical protein
MKLTRNKLTGLMVLLTLISFQGCLAPKQSTSTVGDNLYKLPDSPIKSRWYTYENPEGLQGGGGKTRYGRKGAPCVAIPAGESLTIADIKEGGTIRRIWMTLWTRNEVALRGIKIEIFWDGAAKPAVQAPLGDFFCQSMGKTVAFQNVFFSSPEGKSFNCIIPMPFRKSAKVVLTNESEVNNGVYYEVDATLGENHDEHTLYFHSSWRRENPTTLRKDFTILPQIDGKGRFLGCNIGVKQNPCCTNFWWGEGEVKVYLDGDKEYPTLCGTGTEDYIGSGYGQSLYSHLYQGDQYISEKKDAYGFYRLHVPDPIYFYKDIRVTIQVMGGPGYRAMLQSMDKNPGLRFMKAGDGTQYYTREELEANPRSSNVMERIDDYCATAYWFMDKPENNLPPIAGVAERLKDLP